MNNADRNLAKQRRRQVAIRRNGKGGARALVAGIIAVATTDFFGDDPDQRESAARYFSNSVYTHHLGLLDLEPSLLPEAVDKRVLRKLVISSLERDLTKAKSSVAKLHDVAKAKE